MKWLAMNKPLELAVLEPADTASLEGRLAFEVPSSVEQIVLDFEVDQPVWMQIFIYKNEELIGQAVMTHKQTVRTLLIGKDLQTTSSTIETPTDLTGSWVVTYVARPGFSERVNLSVKRRLLVDDLVLDEESQLDISVPLIKDKSGWLKGDFHTHTHLSDGDMSRSENIESAKQQGLDFFFATEHDVVNRKWPEQSDVIVFPGVELTSSMLGHCNFLGASTELFKEAADYKKMANEEGMRELLQQNKDNGYLSINHPYLEPWEWNTDIPLDAVTSLEIINDPTFKDNTEASIQAADLWSRLWEKGVKVTGVGGSDSHLKPDDSYNEDGIPSLIGDPGTYVYAEQLCMAHVLEAVKNGHTKISRIGECHLSSEDKNDLLPGQQLEDSVRHFKVTLPEDAKEYLIEWVFDGHVIKSSKVSSDDSIALAHIGEDYHWLRVDIKDGAELVATFNPVYWNDKEPEIVSLKEVL